MKGAIWGQRNPHRDARFGQPADRLEPAPGRCRPRLPQPREVAIQRRDRHERQHQALPGHARQQVHVALDQRRLGDHRRGMLALGEHLEDLAGVPVLALDRLVGVGRRPDVDRLAAIAGCRELVSQQARRVLLEEEPGLEVDARRQVHVAVVRSRVAVDASVLAAPVGVHRELEGHIGRTIAGDDRARILDAHDGARGAGRLRHAPSVVEALAAQRLEAPLRISDRAAPLERTGPALHGSPRSVCMHSIVSPPGAAGNRRHAEPMGRGTRTALRPAPALRAPL